MLSARQQKVQIVSDLALARIDLLLELGGSFDPSTRPNANSHSTDNTANRKVSYEHP